MNREDLAGLGELQLAGAEGLAVRGRRRAGQSGVTVLLLHGWPGSGADWNLAIAHAGPAAFGGAEVIAPDLRGFGRSDHPPTKDPMRYGPSAHVADLQAVLDQVRATRVVVVGYDLGATVARHLAGVDERVRGLVLGCPPYPGVGQRRFEPAVQAELWYQQLHLQPWAPRLVAHDRATVEVYLRHFYTHWWGDGAVDEEHFQRTVDLYSAPGAFEASIGWYRARSRDRVSPARSSTPAPVITAPTIVLWGDADPVMPIRFADRLGEHFADVELVELEGVGHFIPLEAAAEVAAAIARLVTAAEAR